MQKIFFWPAKRIESCDCVSETNKTISSLKRPPPPCWVSSSCFVRPCKICVWVGKQAFTNNCVCLCVREETHLSMVFLVYFIQFNTQYSILKRAQSYKTFRHLFRRLTPLGFYEIEPGSNISQYFIVFFHLKEVHLACSLVWVLWAWLKLSCGS